MSEKRAVVALVSGFGMSLAAGAGIVFGSVSVATNVAKFFVQRHKVGCCALPSRTTFSLCWNLCSRELACFTFPAS